MKTQSQWLFEAPVVSPPVEKNNSPYPVVPGKEYGPKWKSRRPPGLPNNARLTSRSNAALLPIDRLARSHGQGEIFVTTVKHLAQTESGAMFGRPANIFNALPSAQRQGKPFISAWGVFQFNRAAWRSLRGVASTASPWDSTPHEEIARPLQKYAELFAEVRAAGGTELDAAGSIRLWHITPTGYLRYLKDGRQHQFLAAWERVPVANRRQIDRHLRQVGVLSEQSDSSNRETTETGGGRVKVITIPPESRLVKVRGYRGKKVLLLDQAAQSYLLLVEAARSAGLAAPTLELVSGFRSVAHQKQLWDAALKRYGSEAEARKWVAPPGKSVHQTGRAIDLWLGFGISSKNVKKMRATSAYQWLVQNAASFGFYPYDREPWHWEYNPPT